MFGSIGIPEIILIFVVVLLLFGPDKLPDFAKTFGKTVREVRRTINDAKATIEEEINKTDISPDLDLDISHDLTQDLKEVDQDLKKITRMEIEDEKSDRNDRPSE